MQRKDYTMDELLNASEQTEEIERTGQFTLFANEDGEVEPTLLKQYIAHYRSIIDDERFAKAYMHLSLDEEDITNE
jgi:hypothetical protein